MLNVAFHISKPDMTLRTAFALLVTHRMVILMLLIWKREMQLISGVFNWILIQQARLPYKVPHCQVIHINDVVV